jgi:hypothetical protein
MKRLFSFCAVFTLLACSIFAQSPAAGKKPGTPYRTVYFPVKPGDRQAVKEINEMLRLNASAEFVSMTTISETGTTVGILVVVKLPPGDEMWMPARLSREEFDKMNKGPAPKAEKTP